jgi:hypothetical protein
MTARELDVAQARGDADSLSESGLRIGHASDLARAVPYGTRGSPALDPHLAGEILRRTLARALRSVAFDLHARPPPLIENAEAPILVDSSLKFHGLRRCAGNSDNLPFTPTCKSLIRLVVSQNVHSNRRNRGQTRSSVKGLAGGRNLPCRRGDSAATHRRPDRAAISFHTACSIQSCAHHTTAAPVVSATDAVFFKPLISLCELRSTTDRFGKWALQPGKRTTLPEFLF